MNKKNSNETKQEKIKSLFKEDKILSSEIYNPLDDSPNPFTNRLNYFITNMDNNSNHNRDNIRYDKFKSNIHVYSRDINLYPKLEKMYHIGELLYHPDCLYYASQIKGIKKSHRFLVYSPYMHSITGEDINWISDFELSKSDVGEMFKVIDIYKKENKTQITLLNYPITAKSDYNKCELDLEKELVIRSRKSFDLALKRKVSLDLDDEHDFLFKKPIGIMKTDQGYDYYSEIDICYILKILSSISDEFGVEEAQNFIIKHNVDMIINTIRKINNEIDNSYEESAKEDLSELYKTALRKYIMDIFESINFISNVQNEIDVHVKNVDKEEREKYRKEI